MASPIKASEFGAEALGEFLNDYDYQPTLTPHLDSLEGIEFTQRLVNEIVLWKVKQVRQHQSGLTATDRSSEITEAG